MCLSWVFWGGVARWNSPVTLQRGSSTKEHQKNTRKNREEHQSPAKVSEMLLHHPSLQRATVSQLDWTANTALLLSENTNTKRARCVLLCAQ